MPKRILVVDDDSEMLKVISGKLRRGGVEVETAVSAKDAQALIDAGLKVDEATIDGLDGSCFALADKLRDIPVTILSGDFDILNRAEAEGRSFQGKSGLLGFLNKLIGG